MRNFTQDQIQKIRQLDLSQGRKGNLRRFFKIEKTKQFEIQLQKKKEQKKALQRKIQRKTQAIELVQKDIQEIGQKVQQL